MALSQPSFYFFTFGTISCELGLELVPCDDASDTAVRISIPTCLFFVLTGVHGGVRHVAGCRDRCGNP